MDTVNVKLERGIQRLREAGTDRDALGQALLSLHGALEDYFRSWLSTSQSVPVEQRRLAQDRQQMQWKGLLDLMQEYGKLSEQERRTIQMMNSFRQKVAHGDSFEGTQQDLEAYVTLIQQLTQINTPKTAPPPKPEGIRPKTKSPTAAEQSVALDTQQPSPVTRVSQPKPKSEVQAQPTWPRQLWQGQGKPAIRWRDLISSILTFSAAIVCYSFALSSLRWQMPLAIIGWILVLLTLLLIFFCIRGFIRVLWQLGIKRLLVRISILYIIATIVTGLLFPSTQQGLRHWFTSAINVVLFTFSNIGAAGQALADAPDSIRFASTGERSAVRVPGVAWEGNIPPTPLSIDLVSSELLPSATRSQPTEQLAPTEIQREPNLQRGARARIVGTDGAALRVREAPSSDSRIIVRLPELTEVVLIDGPQTNEGRVWWRIRHGDSEGWCAAEFLQSITN